MEKVRALDIVEVAFTTYWMLWKNRNQVKHEHCCDLAGVVVQKALRFHGDYLKAIDNDATRSQPSRKASTVWEKPAREMVKLNIDASVNKHIGDVQLGVVARDEDALVVFSVVHAAKGVWDVLQPELMALLFGLEMAKECSLRRVMVESDSLISVEEIMKGIETFNPWSCIVYVILYLSILNLIHQLLGILLGRQIV